MKITVTHFCTPTNGREEEVESFTTGDPHAAEAMVATMASDALVIDDARFGGRGALWGGRIEWTVAP